MNQCTIAGCEKPRRARGYCNMHWKRWRRNGDPLVAQRDWGHGKLASVIGYSPAHKRVQKIKGRAAEHRCAHCGDPAHDWAYDFRDPDELIEVQAFRDTLVPMRYSLNPDRYMPLCRSCHRHYDRAMSPHRPRRLREACKRGHAFTPENTYIPPGRPNARNCRACLAIHAKRRAS